RVDGSTLELYRRALRLRRRNHLGLGALTWTADAATGVLAFTNGHLAVTANLSSSYVDLPTGTQLVLASDVLRVVDDVVQLPRDTTAWVLVAGQGGSEVQRP
ncbi:MAG: DUF3459 domain-containing protein, partial [Mycobacteriaceae bacterium]